MNKTLGVRNLVLVHEFRRSLQQKYPKCPAHMFTAMTVVQPVAALNIR